MRKQYLFKLLVACCFLGNISCGKPKQQQEEKVEVTADFPLPYNLNEPTERYELPKKLREISGLSYYKGTQLVAVNDEEGVVYFFDYKSGKIVNEISFGKAGDYEGIEVVGDEIFILKSNGKIKSFKVEEAFEREIDCTDPDVVEYEGLAYDAKQNYLLLAAKERIKEVDDRKVIYAYDLKKKTFFKSIVIPENQVAGDTKNKDFRPSGIAIHPKTGETFIVASVGKKLLVLASDGKKETLVNLDKELYYQPEGICFAPNGDLFISSEGDKKDDVKGYILRFAHK